MTSGPRCALCDSPLVILDLWWVCPEVTCPRYHLHVYGVV